MGEAATLIEALQAAMQAAVNKGADRSEPALSSSTAFAMTSAYGSRKS